MFNGESLTFTGEESLTIRRFIYDFYDTFTYEFFAKPTAIQSIDPESHEGVSGIKGKRYAIGPSIFPEPHRAGAGISVGTNGVAIYEHATNYLPAVLVYETAIHDWTHIAVVYQQKTPSLYINGRFVKKGKKSMKEHIHPSAIFGGFSPYGFYRGELKDIRIWNHARTEEQIHASMNQPLTGTESGLYYHYNQSPEITSDQYEKKQVDVSIIIPSHNKFPENTFTLRSLSNQTFDLSNVEIILVDDGSTDATSSIIHMNPYPFLFKFVQMNRNKGRSQSRNVGLQFACGKIIIFLDAETIVSPHFIEEHWRSHQEKPNTAVSAVMNQKGVYTVFHPNFNSKQREQSFVLMKNAGYSYQKMNQLKTSQNKTPIVTYSDIDNHVYNKLSFVKPHEPFYENQLLKPFGDQFKGFQIPWLAFFTGNVSVPRTLLEKAGPFEEQFEGYGWEDTEMGYRLYQVGAKFFHNRNMTTYHQEHPIAPSIPVDAKKNSYRFLEMYRNDIGVLSLALILTGNVVQYTKLNNIINEYKLLENDHKDTFTSFKQSYQQLLLTLGYLYSQALPIKNLLHSSKIPSDRSRYGQLLQEIESLKKEGKYPTLMETFDLLIAL